MCPNMIYSIIILICLHKCTQTGSWGMQTIGQRQVNECIKCFKCETKLSTLNSFWICRGLQCLSEIPNKLVSNYT